jgi:pimeloyl-ACP methyl ester carboxylesterase
MTPFNRDGAHLAYRDTGNGRPVLFQHGLGGDEAQVADVFPDAPTIRRITLECRGQGGSAFGPAQQLSIATFTDDLNALAQRLELGAAIVGGISMGAAIALRMAVRRPECVRALVLARPAWVTASAPSNMKPYGLVGELLEHYPSQEARRRFDASETAAELRQLAPDNLASLTGFFSRTEPIAFGGLLRAIAADGPGVTEQELLSIEVPTLVIGHDRDLAHPLAYAETLARLIPKATLKVITPKAVDRNAYRQEFRDCLAEFLDVEA